MEMGNSIGVTIQLPEGKKPVPATEGLFVPGVSETPRREMSLPPWSPSSVEETGCYLAYDADGCRLIQHYSKTKVAEAVAFFAPGPGQTIPAFKFRSNQGRSSLIGNCSGGVEGRKRYYSGWCQFVRAAKAAQGTLWLFPRNTLQGGLAVDICECTFAYCTFLLVFISQYCQSMSDAYTTKPKPGAHQTVKLQDNVNHDIYVISAVACLPRHAEFFEGLTMDLTRWVEEGSKVGAASQV
jgi:Immune Mapped Protein 2 (IMP2) N-terminal domain